MAASSDVMKMTDLTIEEVAALCNTSYFLYGSTTTTAKLIFHGLYLHGLNPLLVAPMADFFTESEPQVAAALYYYLYERRESLDGESRNRFMAMFSDAMYQYGLSKHKTKKSGLTLGEITKHEDFEFDLERLKNISDSMTKDFGSLENFVLVIQNTLGVLCGFVKKRAECEGIEYLLEEARTTNEYAEWTRQNPREMKKLVVETRERTGIES